LLLLVCFCINLSAQTFSYRQFSVKEGLSQSQIFALHQDSKGNIWIGTIGGGINIYNGKEFKSLSIEDGLAGNSVYAIQEDSLGAIWIGTDKGLSVYKNKKIKNYSIKNGLPQNVVYSLFYTNKGEMWVGTTSGVAVFKNNHFKILRGNHALNTSSINNIFCDKSNNIWFGTATKGIIKYDRQQFIQYTTNNGLSHNNVITITQDAEEKIWVGCQEGVCSISGDEITIVKTKSAYTASLFSRKKELWFCKLNGWLTNIRYKENVEGVKPISKLFNNCKLKVIIEDREGNFWLGTEGQGLILLPANTCFYNYNEESGLQNNNVYSVFESSTGDIWIGTESKGLSRFTTDEYKRPTFEYFLHDVTRNSLIGSRVIAIVEDNYQNIWFGTNNGICYRKPNDTLFYNFSPIEDELISKYKPYTVDTNITSVDIRYIYKDSKNTLWFGTRNGITIYKDSMFINFNKKFNELQDQEIYNIIEDNTHNYWFSSSSGVFKYNGKTLKHFTKKDGFTDTRVSTVVQDNSGNFWFATKEGIFRYNHRSFDKIDKSKGLSSNVIYLLMLDNDNNLYVGSNNGIDKINIRSYNSYRKIQIKHFGNLEGFMGQECNINACNKDSEGKLWFGTINGVTIYDARYDDANLIAPTTYISDIELKDKKVDWLKYSDGIDLKTNLPLNLVLPYDENYMKFVFVSNSLTIPEKVKYQYMLEGQSMGWLSANSNEVIFQSLTHGTYTFKVRSCNNDGIWSEIPASFTFTIKPPFWLNKWFLSTMVIFLIIGIYLFIKRREANLQKEKIVLEEKVEERTVELVKQKTIVEQKNKDITDSINYAKNIQEAILPKAGVDDMFVDSFIMYRPRDIVSGDFYWIKKDENRLLIAAADCTGHGVPGAFMSILGIAFLNEIIIKNPFIEANEILNLLRDNVIVSLHQTGKEGESKDGMDLALCVFDIKTGILQFAGANNPMYLIRNNEIKEIKPDKMPVGFHYNIQSFNNNYIELYPGDKVYIFSDGFADQFGGPKGKKFKYAQLKEILLNIYTKPMSEQKTILESTFDNWIGDLEQIDDILVIGVQFK